MSYVLVGTVTLAVGIFGYSWLTSHGCSIMPADIPLFFSVVCPLN